MGITPHREVEEKRLKKKGEEGKVLCQYLLRLFMHLLSFILCYSTEADWDTDWRWGALNQMKSVSTPSQLGRWFSFHRSRQACTRRVLKRRTWIDKKATEQMVSVMQGERNWRFFVKRNILSTAHRNCQPDKAWLMVGLLAHWCVCARAFIFLCEGVVVMVGGAEEVWVFQISWNQKTTDSLSAHSSQCIVCGQWANISALCVCVCESVCVCRQQAVVPMVVCYWLVISVGNRSCYQAWHGDRRGWMMHGTGKLFRRKDNGATHTCRYIHTHGAKMNGCILARYRRFLHTQ